MSSLNYKWLHSAKIISPSNPGIFNKIVGALTGASALLDMTANDAMEVDDEKRREKMSGVEK